MIGRTDVVIPRPVEDDGKRAILRILLAAWPGAIFEDAESDEEPAELGGLDLDALTDEFFVYRDAAALQAWDQEGGTDDNLDSMVHLLLGPVAVTCVVDHREGGETRAIAARIERALERVELPALPGPFFEGLDDPNDWIEGVAA
jgi:hypothetical protein